MKNTEIILEEGTDLTKILSIAKHDPQIKEENDLEGQAIKKTNWLNRLLMNFGWYRWIYFKLNSFHKGWPEWIAKTDECRIQVCAKILMEHFDDEWYITEKLDGQSATFFTYVSRVWGFAVRKFGVCSRNIWLKTKGNNNYWKMADKYNMKKSMLFNKFDMTVQGEICGAGIQGNKYKLPEMSLYVFNVISDGEILPFYQMRYMCNILKLNTVPIIDECFVPSRQIKSREVKDVVQFMLKLSEGKSKVFPRNREGIVVRLKDDPKVSFKVINPVFLLEEGE